MKPLLLTLAALMPLAAQELGPLSCVQGGGSLPLGLGIRVAEDGNACELAGIVHPSNQPIERSVSIRACRDVDGQRQCVTGTWTLLIEVNEPVPVNWSLRFRNADEVLQPVKQGQSVSLRFPVDVVREDGGNDDDPPLPPGGVPPTP